MTIRFSSRVSAVTASSCALCVAGLLALGPAAVADEGGAGSGGADRARTAAGHRPSLLNRSGTQVRPREGAPRVPRLSALSWVIADADTGEVLAARNAHRKLPPASTLKTLFALTVLPTLPAGIRHTVDEEELAGIGPGSSMVGVAEDRTYRISDLWNGVFLNSGNDAVHVLAHLNGGWRTTAARMQAKARALGAHDTRVLSPDGYDTPGQVSSAFDLAVFGRAGLRNKEFARYCGTVEARFPARDGGSYAIRNTNRLLTGSDGVEPYPGLIGIKNGYTSQAGHTLVTAARKGGRTLVVTVMNPQYGGGFAVYEEARELLDWGFEAADRVDAVGSLDELRAKPRPGPEPVTAAAAPVAKPAHKGPGWAEAGMVAGAGIAGAGVMALTLRPARRRETED
ncbi:serine hydrolase [Streptomyces sp. NBRC 14336]|uniref:D-alanyl-D-alanine carboxypeptidase family protein n=1 Tax=Streptomyces sp. NBRC 14336 TaxID=3030992 RepID=UPI0025525760|nr:serine hydrolase [Streptomyces sp. NBRC 14336]WBO76165.1 serine hydrolase [Streptomyces sp. SBE_14.2]